MDIKKMKKGGAIGDRYQRGDYRWKGETTEAMKDECLDGINGWTNTRKV
jgi:hypothetical protein